MSIPKRHHYIPKFYLSRWVGSDGKICEFSRPYKKVKPRRTHPSGTGYKDNLYTVEGLPPDSQNWLEEIFLKVSDQNASDALEILEKGKITELSIDQKSSWSRFIMSLLQRNPEKIDWMRTQWEIASNLVSEQARIYYPQFREIDDPETYEEYWLQKSPYGIHVTTISMIQNAIDMPSIGAFINDMRWNVVNFSNHAHTFLTSDRPVVMTDGIDRPDGHIVLPLNPSQLFIATKTIEMEKFLKTLDQKQLIKNVNDRVSAQAMRYVYSTDDRQLRFVENRLGLGTPQFVAPIKGEDIFNARDVQKMFEEFVADKRSREVSN